MGEYENRIRDYESGYNYNYIDAFVDNMQDYVGDIIQLGDKKYLILKPTITGIFVYNFSSNKVQILHFYYKNEKVLDDVYCISKGNKRFVVTKEQAKIIKELGFSYPNMVVSDKIKDYDELHFIIGSCIYSKSAFDSSCKEVTTSKKIDRFINFFEKKFKKVNKGNVYGCLEVVKKRENSCCPGPVRTWDVPIMGWQIDINDGAINIISGIKSKFTDERMYSTTKSYKNLEFTIDANDEIIEMINLLGVPNVKSIKVWCENKYSSPTMLINGDKVEIYCPPKKTYTSYFDNFKGEYDDHPYDPSVWGWT